MKVVLLADHRSSGFSPEVIDALVERLDHPGAVGAVHPASYFRRRTRRQPSEEGDGRIPGGDRQARQSPQRVCQSGVLSKPVVVRWFGNGPAGERREG